MKKLLSIRGVDILALHICSPAVMAEMAETVIGTATCWYSSQLDLEQKL